MAMHATNVMTATIQLARTVRTICLMSTGAPLFESLE